MVYGLGHGFVFGILLQHPTFTTFPQWHGILEIFPIKIVMHY